MQKKQKASETDAATLERFERALRNALSTPPERPVKSKKRAGKAKRKS